MNRQKPKEKPLGPNAIRHVLQVCSLLLLAATSIESQQLFAVGPEVPANDNFSDRTVLLGPTNTVESDNSMASLEPGEPRAPSCDPAGRSLWWTYTAPGSGTLQISAAGIANGVVWSLYRGDALGGLDRIAYSCELPMILSVASNETFQISVDGAFGKAGGMILNVILTLPPPNDAFADSVQLVGNEVTYTGNFTAATLEPGEPYPGDESTVWASWAAPSTGRAGVRLETSPAWQSVRGYTGPSVERLQPIFPIVGAWNRGFTFLAIEGRVYHFQFFGHEPFPFQCNLQHSPFEPPSNDDFANAILINGNLVNLSSSVMGATMELVL